MSDQWESPFDTDSPAPRRRVQPARRAKQPILSKESPLSVFDPSPQDPRQQSQQQSPQQQSQQQSPQPVVRHRGFDRHRRISNGIIAYNIIFLAIFISAAVCCGYYAWMDDTSVTERQRSMLSAASVASAGGAVSSLMCLAYVARRKPGSFVFVDAPWYVPFVIMGSAVVPAAICGTFYMDDELRGVGSSQSLQADVADLIADPTNTAAQEKVISDLTGTGLLGAHERDLAAFSIGLGIIGVTIPWLGTSAVSWCP